MRKPPEEAEADVIILSLPETTVVGDVVTDPLKLFEADRKGQIVLGADGRPRHINRGLVL